MDVIIVFALWMVLFIIAAALVMDRRGVREAARLLVAEGVGANE